MGDIARIAALWILFSAAGEAAISRAVARWPAVASAQGAITADAFVFLLRVGWVAFVLVALVVVYSAARFRVPPDDLTDSPRQYRSHRVFAGAWVLLSIGLILLFVITPGLSGLGSLWRLDLAAARDPATLEVDVRARQWDWAFSYPAYRVYGQDTLVLPVGTPVKLVLTSADVIHSFWVPAFGLKKDVIPGETRILYVTPTRVISTDDTPVVRVQCAELCGTAHATMRAVVQVVPRADFEKWIAQHR